jgi:hypothetical protein
MDAARWRYEEDMGMEAVLKQMIYTTDARFDFALVIDVHIQGVDAVPVFRIVLITRIVLVARLVLVHEVVLWVPGFSSGGGSGGIPHGGEIVVST